ncbi:MAG: DinB family protein [Vicinamibacterales bacterium]
MHNMLRDLYAHQAWANAEHWRAIQASDLASTDAATHSRLHHITLVEQLFLWVGLGGQGPLPLTKPDDFATLTEMAPLAKRVDEEAVAFVEGLSGERIETQITIPWVKNPPLTLSLGQALLQAAMHSHYHRGQNATRLRELGGEPPLTDLIVWYWKERPAPEWQ